MKRFARWGFLAVLGASVAAGGFLTSKDASAAHRRYRRHAKAKKAEKPQTAPMVKRGRIRLHPTGMHWGMTEKQVLRFYDRLIDKAFVPKYKKAQPGPETDRLDATVARIKAGMRRSRVEFGDLPTGMDSTPLKNEYTYRNGESMLRIRRRGGGKRYFFFMKGKLWKIYDVYPLGPKSRIGKTYADVLKKFATRYGVVGRVTEPDFAAGRFFREVDWQDARTHLRVLDRGKMVAIVYEDRQILDNIDSYRTHKEKKEAAVDPEVQSLIRSNAGQLPNQRGNQDKDKDKKKKKHHRRGR